MLSIMHKSTAKKDKMHCAPQLECGVTIITCPHVLHFRKKQGREREGRVASQKIEMRREAEQDGEQRGVYF